ncbi:MAG: hypothetical protein AAF383_13025 [Cyanobacteria bacterium P01_A01_bin.83]
MTSDKPSKTHKQSNSKPKANPNLNSSLVHKPFATGTINIFNPYRHKSNQASNQPNQHQLFLNAQLEDSTESTNQSIPEPEPTEFTYQEQNWVKAVYNPWSISAIAIILLANLISGAVIWRNYRLANSQQNIKPLAIVGSANLTTAEFIPLNLSTLSLLDTAEDTVQKATVIEPISPALAPINDTAALSSINSPYYYILREYTGDRDLALARQKVKQVSLVNFPQGVFIYLGAFTEREQAEQFISDLKQENFAAQIYPFD